MVFKHITDKKQCQYGLLNFNKVPYLGRDIVVVPAENSVSITLYRLGKCFLCFLIDDFKATIPNGNNLPMLIDTLDIVPYIGNGTIYAVIII